MQTAHREFCMVSWFSARFGELFLLSGLKFMVIVCIIYPTKPHDLVIFKCYMSLDMSLDFYFSYQILELFQNQHEHYFLPIWTYKIFKIWRRNLSCRILHFIFGDVQFVFSFSLSWHAIYLGALIFLKTTLFWIHLCLSSSYGGHWNSICYIMKLCACSRCLLI